MPADKILLFGYPFDRLTKVELEDAIRQLIEGYFKDHRPRFATSLNALIIGQLSSCRIGHRLQPEVCTTLMQADFIGLDSRGLQFLAKLLGNEIDDLIGGVDLLHATATFLAKHNQSLYMIGGREELSKQVAEALQEDYPGLKIAGIASPSIYTKGERLETSIEMDPLTVDAINSAKPTVLILHLGHPKQEIWFERIKDQLKVPLCIGIGGAFESYLRQRKSSKLPRSESFSGSKLQRRLSSALHYLCWVPPLFLYNTISRLLYDAFHKWRKNPPSRRYLFLSEKESLSVIPFPPLVNALTWYKKTDWIESLLEHDNIVIDFSKVRHLDLMGLGLLYKVWKEADQARKNFFIVNISSDIRTFLKLHGAWNLIAYYVCSSPEEVLERMSINKNIDLKSEREFVSIHQLDSQTILSYFGTINGVENAPYAIRHLEPLLENRNCILNLNYCTSISNKGFGFLLQLQDYQRKQNQTLTIANPPSFVRRQFSERKLNSLFQFS